LIQAETRREDQYDVLPTWDNDGYRIMPADGEGSTPVYKHHDSPRNVADEYETMSTSTPLNCSESKPKKELALSSIVDHYDYLPQEPLFVATKKAKEIQLLKSLCLSSIAFVEVGNRIW